MSRFRTWLKGRAARVAAGAATARGRIVVRGLGLAVVALLLLKLVPDLIDGNDFSVYYAAGKAALAGEDIFTSRGIEAGRMYVYPPTLAALIAPLAALPYSVACVVWALLMIGSLGYVVWGLLACLGAREPAERWLVGGLIVATVARPLDSEFGNGQVNLMVIACVTAGALAFTRTHPFRCGLWVGLAACLKATPALFFAYFLLKREWKVLGGGVAAAVLFLGLVPALATGDPGAGPRDTLEWARRVAEPALASSRMTAEADADAEPVDAAEAAVRAHEDAFVPGHSLRAIVFRYTTRTPIDYRHPEDPMYANLVDLPRDTAQRIYAGLALLICVLTAWACGLGSSRTRPGRFMLELSLFAAAMLLVSPVSRKAHFVALLLPLACGAALVSRGTREDGERGGVRALMWMTACFALFIISSSPVSGKRGSLFLRGIGFYTGTALITWVALLRLTWRGTELPPPPRDPVDACPS